MSEENGHATNELPEIVAVALVHDRPTEIDSDGFIYDAETGEVLGHTGAVPDDGFAIMSPEGADWVLSKMAIQESELARVESLRAALLANLDSMLVEPRNRLAWLHRRFDGELIAQAARDLEAQGGRSRTAKYPHGKVSLRKTPGSAEITDRHLAVEFVAEWAPDHVKRSVGIEGVRAAILAEIDAVDDPGDRTDTARFFRSAGPSERWTIDTGLRAEKGGAR
jgi:hypothetical protein